MEEKDDKARAKPFKGQGTRAEVSSQGSPGVGFVSDPPDFNEGGSQHRKSILASTALVAVLLLSSPLQPEIFGIRVPVHVMWSCLGIGHVYFFVMWRLTAPIENDQDRKFYNLRGLFKQAVLGGTGGFPGKTKAQILLIRALPIWAFLIGLFGIFYGLWDGGPAVVCETTG